TERFSFNTVVSTLMVCVNELTDLNCRKRAVLEPLLVILCPFAPHIAEELWHVLGHTDAIVQASFPDYNASYLTESSKEYPVSINGKLRTHLTLPLDITEAEVKAIVLEQEAVKKWMEGKELKKLIFVPGRMVNVVV
ncbi:MAG: leucine--tRNA ligase, partial [Bacteroidetes bacterium]